MSEEWRISLRKTYKDMESHRRHKPESGTRKCTKCKKEWEVCVMKTVYYMAPGGDYVQKKPYCPICYQEHMDAMSRKRAGIRGSE